MKRRCFETLDQWIGKARVATIALAISSAAPLFAQNLIVNSGPDSVAADTNPQLPKGVKVVAQVSLEGLPITRMYTQWEYGRTYLYIEHGGQQFTTVDVTKKQKPQVVNHEPGKVEPKRYEELAEGGTIEVSPPWHVNAGIDNVGGRGMLSILASSDSDDVQLLQAFGRGSSNLVDRDAHLIFFASPAQLLVVQDHRLSTAGY